MLINTLRNIILRLKKRNCHLSLDAHIIGVGLEGHNSISPGVKIYNSSLGAYSYINYNSIIANSKIGRFCSIGPNCVIGLGEHPTKKFVSTSPFIYRDKYPLENIPVIIGNDVWIGANVTIANGAVIGDGAVIGANSFVKGNIEPFSIVGGAPAKLLGYRFNEKQRMKLMGLQWWNDPENAIENTDRFHDIESFLTL